MKDSTTDKMQRILTALEADESLQDCFLEMIDTTEDKQKKFTNGDDAEDAVVSAIQKTGTLLLQKWLQKKSEEAEALASSDSDLRPHQKKTFSGTHPLEK
jgi:hypothetical protein